MNEKRSNKVLGTVNGEKLLAQIAKINEKVDLDTEFPDWNKSVQFIVHNTSGGEDFSCFFIVKDGKVARSGSGLIDEADVTIEGPVGVIDDLFNGDLPVIGAVITKKMIIKGRIGDAVGANVLLQAARTF